MKMRRATDTTAAVDENENENENNDNDPNGGDGDNDHENDNDENDIHDENDIENDDKQQQQQQQQPSRLRGDVSWSTDDDDDDVLMLAAMEQERKAEEQAGPSIAQRETHFVQWTRLLVLCLLIGTTISVAYAVYTYTTQKEQDQFEQDFVANANKVVMAMRDSIDLTLTAVDSIVVTMVSFARYANATWPFVTLPNFEITSAKIRTLSKSTYINQYLLVTKEQRTAWEEYAAANNAWVNQSIQIQAKDEHFYGPLLYDYYTVHAIHNYQEEPMPDDMEYHYVTWQSSPMIPRYAPYNWDLMAYDDNRSVVAIQDYHRVVLTESYHLPDPNNVQEVADNAVDVDFFSDYVQPGQDPSEPMTDVYYPILDTVDQVTIQDPENYPLRGIFAVSLFWRSLMENILPTGSNGMIVVIENHCNPSFTYQINGPDVVYLGRGDLHDPTYQRYENAAFLLDAHSQTMNRSNYAGVPVNRDFCPYHIRVYPSHTTHDLYTSQQPKILTAVAVMIFLFTSAVFVFYDGLVEYRQQRVLTAARKTSAIVSSLFPSNVRDRLLQQQGESLQFHNGGGAAAERDKKKNKQKRKSSAKSTSADTHLNMSGSVNGDVENEDDDDTGRRSMHRYDDDDHRDDSSTAALHGPPIADLFLETTIFFADLVGFTQWSSTRSPTQVFELLETIYGAFDATARRRGIFKVETVGDCYVAAAGIPQPQPNHAILMIKFARDCLRKLNRLLRTKLATQFGEDTVQLQMRVGIHSGPTTAGVLRGEKGRFQLFGDTVNTASRMESHGVAGRIHISEATARELLMKGKGHWLQPRSEKIVAKGKGEMQTYFVTTDSTTTAHRRHGSTSSSGGGGGRANSVEEATTACTDGAAPLVIGTTTTTIDYDDYDAMGYDVSIVDSETDGTDDMMLFSDDLEANLKSLEEMLTKRNNQLLAGMKAPAPVLLVEEEEKSSS